MKVRFFDPGLGYRKIKSEIDEEVQRVFSEGKMILQEDVEKFEESFAQFVGTKYAVGVNSGTDAMYLSLWALGCNKNSTLLTSGHTFVASLEVGRQLGGSVGLVDIDNEAMMDTSELQMKKADFIIPVSMMGEMPDMKTITEYANKIGATVIEDSCQGLGAERNGRKAGAWGATGCFSFYPAKILGCYGDGGAITTNDKDVYDKLINLRNHYKPTYSNWGINSRLDNVQAAILNVKMKYLPSAIERRKEVAERYLKALPSPVGLPHNRAGRVWQDFVIVVSDRDALQKFLSSVGIQTMINDYEFPVPKPPKSLLFEKLTLRIPCNEVLTDDEVGYVIEKINEYYRK